jgi:hypothetical protein
MKGRVVRTLLAGVEAQMREVIALCDRVAARTDEDSPRGHRARHIAKELREGLAEAAAVDEEHEAWLKSEGLEGLEGLDEELDDLEEEQL